MTRGDTIPIHPSRRNGITSRSITSLAVSPANPATVYAGANAGSDAFVTKLNPAGSALVYSRYLGGDEIDVGRGIAVDAAGNAWVIGRIYWLVNVANLAGNTASDVQLNYTLPAGTTYVSCIPEFGTCGGTGNNRTVTISSLAAGQTRGVIFTATVNNLVGTGTTLTANASVAPTTGDADPGNNTAMASVTVTGDLFRGRTNGRIAFASDRAFTGSTEPTGIYTINPDGSGVKLTFNGDVVAAGSMLINRVASSLFAANANGQGVAAAVALRVKADGSQVYEPVARFDMAQNRFVSIPIDLGPATEQVFLILFGTGIGFRADPAAATVKIGDETVETLFAGPQGALAGLDQVNVRLARGLAARGETDVILTIDGKMANTVRVNTK